MKLKSPYLLKPGRKVHLDRLSTKPGHVTEDKATADAELQAHRDTLIKLQDVLYAGQQHAMLIVLQGMDTAGKDGTIRHIFSGINPQGCDVAAFKVPTPLEAKHDFLWRIHAAVPPRGMIGIFNRSHYEDVLSPRVHKLITQKEVRRRLDDINDFEQMLARNNVTILKFFLHISHEEQTARLTSRIAEPDKQWKLSEADFKERRFWPQYTAAYEELLAHTSRKHAPWFVIPADDKWYRNLAISQVLVEAMKSLKMHYPKSSIDPTKFKLE